MAVTLTIDLEDPTERYHYDGRYVALSRRILDMCDQIGCKATFFVIGRVADAVPELITEIARRGHEVAYHSHGHVSLTRDTPEKFKRETKEDKDKFEQLTGKPLVGFRAPRFSLTPESWWAVDVLGELGFKYSSSIMPTEVSLFGYPGAPCTAFKWRNGVAEYPLPTKQFGKYRLAYLGGIYLYSMPFFLVQSWVKGAGSDEVLWTYTHPYDFDREDRYRPMPGTPAWISMVLWLSRRVAEKKVRRVLTTEGAGKPLGELPTDGLPVFEG